MRSRSPVWRCTWPPCPDAGPPPENRLFTDFGLIGLIPTPRLADVLPKLPRNAVAMALLPLPVLPGGVQDVARCYPGAMEQVKPHMLVPGIVTMSPAVAGIRLVDSQAWPAPLSDFDECSMAPSGIFTFEIQLRRTWVDSLMPDVVKVAVVSIADGRGTCRGPHVSNPFGGGPGATHLTASELDKIVGTALQVDVLFVTSQGSAEFADDEGTLDICGDIDAISARLDMNIEYRRLSEWQNTAIFSMGREIRLPNMPGPSRDDARGRGHARSSSDKEQRWFHCVVWQKTQAAVWMKCRHSQREPRGGGHGGNVSNGRHGDTKGGKGVGKGSHHDRTDNSSSRGGGYDPRGGDAWHRDNSSRGGGYDPRGGDVWHRDSSSRRGGGGRNTANTQ